MQTVVLRQKLLDPGADSSGGSPSYREFFNRSQKQDSKSEFIEGYLLNSCQMPCAPLASRGYDREAQSSGESVERQKVRLEYFGECLAALSPQLMALHDSLEKYSARPAGFIARAEAWIMNEVSTFEARSRGDIDTRMAHAKRSLESMCVIFRNGAEFLEQFERYFPSLSSDTTNNLIIQFKHLKFQSGKIAGSIGAQLSYSKFQDALADFVKNAREPLATFREWLSTSPQFHNSSEPNPIARKLATLGPKLSEANSELRLKLGALRTFWLDNEMKIRPGLKHDDLCEYFSRKLAAVSISLRCAEIVLQKARKSFRTEFECEILLLDNVPRSGISLLSTITELHPRIQMKHEKLRSLRFGDHKWIAQFKEDFSRLMQDILEFSDRFGHWQEGFTRELWNQGMNSKGDK